MTKDADQQVRHPHVARRWVLGGLLAGAAAPVWAEGPLTSIRPRRRGAAAGAASAADVASAQALIGAAKLGGTLGYAVADLASGRILESMNPTLEQPPASVAKAMTTLFVLEKLGLSHRFVTQVIVTGPVKKGRVEGDLVLLGSGDPTLSTDQLGDMAAQLAASGVRSVTGRYLVYAGALPAIPEISTDQPDYVGYNPAIGGMNLNYNRVNFEWKKVSGNYSVTMDARGERFLPLVDMARMKIVPRETPLFTYQSGDGVDRWTVAAAALGKGGSRWLPVRHPAEYGAEVFRKLCVAQGISMPEAQVTAARPAGSVLVEHRSDGLDTVLRDMLKFSTNLTAEVMGLTATKGAALASSAADMTRWAQTAFGITAHYANHSGLGGDTRISASDMVKTLVAARRSATGQILPSILRDIGMRDAKGNTVKNDPVRVLAKSGTLNFVSGLAGYIQPPSGPELVFAIFSADTARRDKLRESEREQPEGGEAWTRRARRLQGQLISRWAGLYA